MRSDVKVPQLQVEHYIDQSSGEPSARFLWNGLLLQAIEVTGKNISRLEGLTLIDKDLHNAKKWLEKAHALSKTQEVPEVSTETYIASKDREIFDDVKAYFVAAVTFYGKAFTEANGRHAQMQTDWLDKEFRSAHIELMDLRHNFAAHSGDMQLEKVRTRVLLIPSKNGIEPKLHHQRVQPDSTFTSSDGKNYIDLISHAISVVTERHRKLKDRLGDIVYSYPPQFWELVAKSSTPLDLDREYRAKKKK